MMVDQREANVSDEWRRQTERERERKGGEPSGEREGTISCDRDN